MEGHVRVERTPEKGRHLVAERDFTEGEVVASQDPYAAVLFNKNVTQYCNYCFVYGEKLRRCSRSKFAHYCSRECQLRDWKEGYKKECDLLVKSSPRVLPASVRLVAQVAWRRTNELENPPDASEFWNSYQGVELMVDHWDDLPDDKMKSFAEMGLFISNICPHLPEEGLSLDEPIAKSFARLFAKFSFNNHTVSCSRLSNLGLGVYPLLAMCNHSSSPNAIQRFNGKRCEFRAIRPIKAGEEVCISYVDLLNTSIEVHEILKDYLFDFIPQLKETRQEKLIRIDASLSARIWKSGQPQWVLNDKDRQLMKVLNKRNGTESGVMVLVHEGVYEETTDYEEEDTEGTAKSEEKQPERPMTVCFWGDWVSDKKLPVVEFAKNLKAVREAVLRGHDLYYGDRHKEAISLAKTGLKQCFTCLGDAYSLPDTHILRLRCVDLLCKVVVDLGSDWNLAKQCYHQLVAQHDVLYPHYWSERGSQLAALARLEAMTGDLRRSMEFAQKAIHVLRVTDGGGDVLEEMKRVETTLLHEINLRSLGET